MRQFEDHLLGRLRGQQTSKQLYPATSKSPTTKTEVQVRQNIESKSILTVKLTQWRLLLTYNRSLQSQCVPRLDTSNISRKSH